MTTRPMSAGSLTLDQRQIVRCQSTEEIKSNNAQQNNINQQIRRYAYDHHNVLYRQNQRDVQLGHSNPSNENSLLHSFASSQSYLPAEHVDCPMDERVRFMDDYHLSSTIEERFIYPRESECIQDTQEHRMLPTIILNNIGSSQITHGENNRINMDVVTQNNPGKITAPLSPIDIPAETTVIGNAVTGAPHEISQDTDFSVITSETQNIHEISKDSVTDEESLIPDSFMYVEDNDESIHCNNQIVVETSPNNAAIANVVSTRTPSNQMNNVDEQSARTKLTNNTDTLSPETLEIARDIATNEATPQASLCVGDIQATRVAKLPTAFEPIDESNEEICP
ncbi:unnamed protein product [Rotaria sp. Silwood2]|nr:unnamed protein product [Rotaria sp. Silwood2]